MLPLVSKMLMGVCFYFLLQSKDITATLIKETTTYTPLTSSSTTFETLQNIKPEDKGNSISIQEYFSTHSLGQIAQNCFTSKEILSCFENGFLKAFDFALKDNRTWSFGEFLKAEKLNNSLNNNNQQKDEAKDAYPGERRERSFSSALGDKMWQLFKSRTLKLQLPKALTNAGISDAVDYFNLSSERNSTMDEAGLAVEEGTVRLINGLVDDKLEAIKSGRKRRKKKYKDKNMAIMGGMAIMAMFAQMFLGKVILIAGAAFIMAKVALIISVLGSLKKGQTGSSGSTEHVIVTGSSGGHSHESSSWHRSMPYDYAQHDANNDPHTKEFPQNPDENISLNHIQRVSPNYIQINAKDAMQKRREYKSGILVDDLNFKQTTQVPAFLR